MNAKKIMGAVLVALLAAALFIGAGAAAAEGTDYGTVFIYQNQTTLPAGAWTLVGGSATVTTIQISGTSQTYVLPSDDFVPGTYKNGADSAYFTKPSATYAGSASINSINYLVANGGKVYNTSLLDVTVTALNKTVGVVTQVQVTYPNGTVVNDTNPFNGAAINAKGTYKVQAVFDASKFIKEVPYGLLLDENVFTFTVVEEDDVTISASVDSAYNSEAVKFTVTGAPGAMYNISVNGFNVSGDQFYKFNTVSDYPDNILNLTIKNNGIFEIVAIVNTTLITDDADKKYAIIELQDNEGTVDNGEIKIKILSPIVTAKTEASSYFVGDIVKISGTATSTEEIQFYMEGTNFNRTVTPITAQKYAAGKTWNAEINTANIVDEEGKKLDVGTYTIILKQDGKVVATLPVALKQPFIQLTSAPEAVVQGTEAKFVGTAEATSKVYYYIFGTNFFTAADVDDADEWDENQFTFTIADTTTKNMAAGQYFVVIQHPMYDTFFNIAPNGTGGIIQNLTGSALVGGTEIFNVTDRQTANAAQALCDALDSQLLDDMYIKSTFFIVGQDESFVINPIPTEVAQGSTFTVSGVDTANAGKTIQVTMLSTMFAAIPKEDANAAAFIVASTEIAEDGTWEITIDTAALAVDEYNLAVKIAGEEKDKKNVKINVVEAGDEPVNPEQPEEPEQPEQPEEPVAPATPGFGALAALAGLGAVAVLLLRRE